MRGYDGGKKVNGRKCHILVDTEGLLLKVKVHEAGMHDRAGGEDSLGRVEWRVCEDEEVVGGLCVSRT